jgi:hypothetical protein
VVLVADNASSDGTVAALSDRFAAAPVEVIAGEENVGLYGNTQRLVRQCSTGHFLLLSDEDDLASRSAMVRLLALLKLSDPAAVMPSRSEDHHAGLPVPPRELWDSTMYLSGIVLSAASGRRALARLDALSENLDLSAILLWPQYLVALDAFLEGELCCWSGEALARKREELPTVLGDESRLHAINRTADRMRGSYKGIEARLAQSAAILALLEAAVREADVTHEPKRAERALEIREVIDDQLYKRLRGRLAYDFPDALTAFDRGARRFVGGQVIRAPASLLRRVVVFLIRYLPLSR